MLGCRAPPMGEIFYSIMVLGEDAGTAPQYKEGLGLGGIAVSPTALAL